MTATTTPIDASLPENEYKRRVWAWTMYDWANSAFATTILAAILPIYFSQVAGATLPSATTATSYWSLGLSLSLLITAVLSPILGTVSDVMRGKKKFLTIFAGLGILATALLVLVTTGNWILAAILGILGRIGFSGANVFYDALLPHVARKDDQDRVSARGYAMGYLGGGILLAINVVMLQVFPGTWGARLSFLSVAIWWGVFTIPLLRNVPEPFTSVGRLQTGANIITSSFGRLVETFRDIRQYRELFKFLLAFLVYNDGIGTIIGVAAIYGAELGFGSEELILALLLVQFVGIPYSLIFGRLPSQQDKRRPIYLAFVLFNLVALPLVGIWGRNNLPTSFTGARPAPFVDTINAKGQGNYLENDNSILYSGIWTKNTVSKEDLGRDQDAVYALSTDPNAWIDFSYNGQSVKVIYSLGANHGIWEVYVDGYPLLQPDSNEPITIDGFNQTERYDVTETFIVKDSGEHTISLINSSDKNPESSGNLMTFASIQVLPASVEVGMMGILKIIGLILLVEATGLALSFLFGNILFRSLARGMTTKRTILLALSVYMVVAVWGYFLDSVFEFWLIAWMIAVVQGGSQALSRSLYSAMSPATKSGEFFGLFGVMEKFSAIIGPLMFAAAGVAFGSSRPAVLSLIVLFVLGGLLLAFVDVEKGKRNAQEEDLRLLNES